MKVAVVKRYSFYVVTILLLGLFVGILGYQLWWGMTRLPVIDRAPDFRLSDVNDKAVTLHDTDGKIRLVSFFYTSCPDICQTTNYNLVSLDKKLAEKGLQKDTNLISISFDSERDTTDHLKKYIAAGQFDRPGWLFLRGEKDEINKAVKGFKIVAEKGSDGFYLHSNKLFLVDGNNNIRSVYKMGSDMDNDQILKDIANLQKEL